MDRNVLIRVSKNGRDLQSFPEFQGNRQIVMTAVKQNGYSLEFASDELKDDKEIVLASLRLTGDVFQYASNKLKSDRDFVMSVVAKQGDAIEFASDALQQDKEVVMIAVKEYGTALRYTPYFQGDADVVMSAVQNKGYALRFASEELKANKEIVLAAIRQDGLSLRYASDALKEDEQLCTEAIRNNIMALSYCKNVKAILNILKLNIQALEYVNVELFEQKDFIEGIVRYNIVVPNNYPHLKRNVEKYMASSVVEKSKLSRDNLSEITKFLGGKPKTKRSKRRMKTRRS